MNLLTEIDDRIRRRHLLGHPFYTSWVAGTLPMEAMQEYARQYYAFESSFPRFLSAIHTRTDDREARQALLENLWDEEHGEANHAELWLRFAEGIGVSREDVRGAEWNDATQRLVDTYRSTTTTAPVAAAVAARTTSSCPSLRSAIIRLSASACSTSSSACTSKNLRVEGSSIP